MITGLLTFNANSAQAQKPLVDSVRVVGIVIDVTGAGVVMKIISGPGSGAVLLTNYSGNIGDRVGLTSAAFRITKETWHGKMILPAYDGSVVRFASGQDPKSWSGAIRRSRGERTIRPGGKPCEKC